MRRVHKEDNRKNITMVQETKKRSKFGSDLRRRSGGSEGILWTKENILGETIYI